MRRPGPALRCAVAILLAATPVAAQGDQLTPSDLLALVDLGAPGADIGDLARRRGLALAWSRRWDAALAARGAPASLRSTLATIATGQRHALPPGEVVAHAASGLTWFLPKSWTLVPDGAHGRLVRHGLPPSVTIDMSFQLLALPCADLRKRSITTLDAYHELRVREIAAAEGRGWTRVGTWPLAAAGWTGVHTAFEHAPEPTTWETVCLTWFSIGDRLLSISTHLSAPSGWPLHDRIVDEITLILTGHAPGIMSREAREHLEWRRRHETLLVVDGRGSVRQQSRDGRDARTLLEGPCTHARWVDARRGLLVARDSKIELRAPGGSADTRVVWHGETSVDELDVDVTGEQAWLWTRFADGRPRGVVLDLAPTPAHEALELPARAAGPGHFGKEPGEIVTATARDGRIELICSSPDAAPRRLAAPIALPGVTAAAVRRDDDAAYVLFETAAEAGVSTVSILRIAAASTGPSGEIWRCDHDPAEGRPRLALDATGHELLVVLPGEGLLTLPRRGGLPVHLPSPGGVRDVSATLTAPVVNER